MSAMSDPMKHETPTTASGTSAPSAMGGMGGDAPDMVWVCRSATLPHAQYRFYRAILLVFPECGTPPDGALLEQFARRFGVDLDATLTSLATHDLVQRAPTTGAITAAYPFSGVPKPHRVTLLTDPQATGSAGAHLYAMCALDALGIPLMLHRPAVITSIDPLTGEAVRVRIWEADATDAPDATDGGAESGVPGWRAAWDPVTAVVYARPEDPSGDRTTDMHDTHDTRDIASACRCPVTNFFTAPAHARQWAEHHGAPGDVLLAPGEALQRAERRFAGLLDRLPDVED